MYIEQHIEYSKVILLLVAFFLKGKYCYDDTNKKVVVESCKFNTMQLLSVLGNSYIIPNTNQLYCEPWQSHTLYKSPNVVEPRSNRNIRKYRGDAFILNAGFLRQKIMICSQYMNAPLMPFIIKSRNKIFEVNVKE